MTTYLNTEKYTSAKSTRGGVYVASIFTLLLLGFILVTVNYISSYVYFRGDFTEENLYTLSPGTRSAVSKLTENVKIRFFFSKSVGNVPFGYKLYGKRVEELLGEYARLAGGMIDLEVNDPQPDTDIEEWAVRYGLAQAGLPTGETFYFGMVVLVADNEEIIPFFSIDREEFLEYDITRAIVQAAAITRPVVGVLSPLPIVGTQPLPFQMQQQGGPTEDWLFLRELRKSFEIKSIPVDAQEIPSDISLLMVIHPKDLSDQTTYAIDQYVVRGGRAIIMVDPLSQADSMVDQSNPFMATMGKSSDLPKLFKAWGIEYDRSKIAADINQATGVNMGREGVVQYPIWLTLGADSMAKDSIISSKLGSMMMIVAGTLSKSADSSHEFIPLLQTTDSGNLIETHRLMSPPAELARGLPSSGATRTLAAMVRGKFKSAYQAPPTQNPAETETEEQKAAREQRDQTMREKHVSEAANPVSIMVVADTDFLHDDYCVRAVNFFGSVLLQPLNDNLAFISNAVDHLAGSEDLIAVRSRGKSARTFTRVEEIEREAQRRWQEEEKNLTRKLEEIQARINELQTRRKDGERLILTAEQRDEIQRARNEKTETMRRRREIRKLLRQDIESLGTRITFANLLLMPFLVALTGVIVYFRQNRKRGI